MQRTHHNVTRPGFALIVAILVVVVVATIMLSMLNIGATTSKRTTDNYLHEQAVLLARSVTEYALLAISGTNRAGGNCIGTIQGAYPNAAAPMLQYTATIRYIGFEDVCPGLNYVDQTGSAIPSPASGIYTDESIGQALIDVRITTPPGTSVTTEPITYHRRTLQKL